MRHPILKRFTVEGAGEFPLDMLRTDQCWPANADDVAGVAAHYGMAEPAGIRARTVTLETSGKHAPNRSRWLSFRWRVID